MSGAGGRDVRGEGTVSIQAMSWVFDNSVSELGDRLVLLSLASHADSSWCCFPSIPALARESRMSERQVYRCLTNLERLGELERASGGGRGRRNTYRIAHYKRCQDDTLNPNLTLTYDALNPDTVVTHNRKEPSSTRAGAHARGPWEAEGALQPLSEEQRKAGMAALSSFRESQKEKAPGQARPGASTELLTG